jgi:hypothetical protein
MQKYLLRGAARRVMVVSVVAVAVFAATAGVAIWRYEYSLSRSAAALDARQDTAVTEKLVATFWREREAMNEYLLAASPAVRQEVTAQRARFTALSAALSAPALPVEARLRSQATAANDRFFVLFTRVQPAAAATAPDEIRASSQLTAAEASVLRPLSELASAQAQRVRAAQAGNASAG